MNITINRLKNIFSNYSKAFENYFFMTFQHGANLLIGLLLYPYLIRILGKEIYGTYTFIISNIQFLSLLIGGGFYAPALKKIALNVNDISIKSKTVSEVFTAQALLFALCTIILATLTYFIPFVRTNSLLYIIIFLTLVSYFLFPTWYFQGIQKMKFITYVNLSLRILTIPFVFILIKSQNDLLKYALITMIASLTAGIFTLFYLQIKEKIKIRFVSFKALKAVFTESIPFFGTEAFNTIKSISVPTVFGIFFSMESVALWDLANKIITIPRVITNNINSALFPNVVQNYNTQRVKKIMNFERRLSVLIIIIIISLSYWAVLLLGGESMLMSYPLTVILSFTFFTWLLVGCYVNFIFIPQNRSDLVFKCKMVEIIALIILLTVSALFLRNIIFLVIAVVLSELIETAYCFFVVRKNKLI